MSKKKVKTDKSKQEIPIKRIKDPFAKPRLYIGKRIIEKEIKEDETDE